MGEPWFWGYSARHFPLFCHAPPLSPLSPTSSVPAPKTREETKDPPRLGTVQIIERLRQRPGAAVVVRQPGVAHVCVIGDAVARVPKNPLEPRLRRAPPEQLLEPGGDLLDGHAAIRGRGLREPQGLVVVQVVEVGGAALDGLDGGVVQVEVVRVEPVLAVAGGVEFEEPVVAVAPVGDSGGDELGAVGAGGGGEERDDGVGGLLRGQGGLVVVVGEVGLVEYHEVFGRLRGVEEGDGGGDVGGVFHERDLAGTGVEVEGEPGGGAGEGAEGFLRRLVAAAVEDDVLKFGGA